jgi:cobalt/nickel transport system permease protein
MKLQGRIRTLHRLATLIIGAQLVIWTATGFAFSWFDFARVRGTDDRAPAAPISLPQTSVADALVTAGGNATSAELKPLLGRPTWVVKRSDGKTVLIDGVDGKPRTLDADQIRQIAIHAYKGQVGAASTARLPHALDIDEEVWRVSLDDPRHTEVFVSPQTGEILSWRNTSWRWFDALWSLHVLGWANRDNPAHLAMRIAGTFAVTVALTGVALLFFAFVKRRRGAAVVPVIALLVLVPRPAHAMHLAEGILPFDWALFWSLVCVPFVAFALHLLRKRTVRDPAYKPFVAMVASAVFLLSCMPVPVPTAGTCSHPCGTGLAAILIGPWMTVLVTVVALLLQALFLAHGGLTTLGADVVSMGIAGAFVGWGVFKLARRGGLSPWAAAFLAGILSDWATYATTSLELAAALRGAKSFGTLFSTVALAFVPTQLPLGILEGFISAGAVAFLLRRRRDLLERLSGVVHA